MRIKDRKLAAVGLTRLLTQSAVMFSEPAINVWYVSSLVSTTCLYAYLTRYHRSQAFVALSKLFSEPQYLSTSTSTDDPHAGLTEIDYEEANAGYQAAYSRLAAAEANKV